MYYLHSMVTTDDNNVLSVSKAKTAFFFNFTFCGKAAYKKYIFKKKPIRKKKSPLSLDLSVHEQYISQKIHQVHQNLFLLLFCFFSIHQLEDGRLFV